MLNLNINSSRALAVILVFLFHLNIEILSGGFIGVDIFFVISGYVISLSLFKLIKKNNGYNFLLEFYCKRLLRILPALIILSIFLIIICNHIFIQKHYYEFLKSVIFSNLFISNFYFWDQFGYFGLQNSFKPLLHSWSLSIEAQIYLIFPIFIFLIYFKRIKLILLLIGIFSILSIFLAHIYIDRPLVYFFPIFRIHEFLIGVLIFIYLDYWGEKKINSNFFYIGLLLIIFSCLTLEKNSSFPGFNSIIPVVGIALIILSEKNLLFAQNKIVQFYGNISYSFYLYHWPIIVLYKYYFLKINFNFFDIIILFFLITLISYLSFKYIELSFKKLKKNNLIKLLVIIFILILVTLFYSKDISSPSNVDIKNLNERKVLEKTIKRKITNPEKPNIIILGDSHAIDLAIALNQSESNLISKFDKIYINLNDDCLSDLNANKISNNIERYFKKFLSFTISKCKEQIKDLKKLNLKSQTILLSSRWSMNSLNYLEPFINEIKKNKNRILIFNRRPSFFDVPSVLEIKKNKSNLNSIFYNLNDKSVIKINHNLKNILKKNRVPYIDIYNQICDDKKKICNVLDVNENILFIDNDHFSIDGSKYFSSKIEKLIQSYID